MSSGAETKRVETIRVYTDGACQGNPGPGGWGWAIDGGPFASGCEKASTNQRMEVWAAFDAVRTLVGSDESRSQKVCVVSDSTYVVNCFNKHWYRGWMSRGWKNAAKQPVANQDLWKPFVDFYLAHITQITFEWVKGHSGNAMNDRVDELAVAAAASQLGRVLVDPTGWFAADPPVETSPESLHESFPESLRESLPDVEPQRQQSLF